MLEGHLLRLLAISGHAEGSAIRSASPPKADIEIGMSASALISSGSPLTLDVPVEAEGRPGLTHCGLSLSRDVLDA